LSCNVACSAGEELLWHYKLHNGEQRVRLADTLHDLPSASTELNSSDCSEIELGALNDIDEYTQLFDGDDAAVDATSPSALVNATSPSALSGMQHASTAASAAGGSAAVDATSPSALSGMQHASPVASVADSAEASAVVVVPDESDDDDDGTFDNGADVQFVQGSKAIAAGKPCDRGHDNDNDTAGAPGALVAQNPSGSHALELQGTIQFFDVAKMCAPSIWNSILLQRHLSGGMLTRSILIAATTDTSCLPLWNDPTTQEKGVQAKKDQGAAFISHFSPAHKLAWLRVKLFTIVAANRATYAKMRVTFNGHTSVTLATAGSAELTDCLRCRIAHLALDVNCVQLLAIIFGSRDLEKCDNKNLSSASIWEQITQNFVNSALWQPFSTAVDCIPACREMDTTVAPPKPGLDPTTIQDVFLELRTDWTRLKTRVSSQTGCHSTGTQLLNEVWDNFINGGLLKFTRPVVAMYVFGTWNNARPLPEFCGRQLHPGQQLQIGVGGNHLSFKTPDKPGSSQRGKGNRAAAAAQSEVLWQLNDTLKQLLPTSTGCHSETPSPTVSAVPFPGTSSSFSSTSSKRAIFAVDQPDEDLGRYMVQNKIMKWWPQIYEKLAITSIADLKFIGKNKVQEYLAELPALPAMKLAALADISEKDTPNKISSSPSDDNR
jgi:hypothetical protein